MTLNFNQKVIQATEEWKETQTNNQALIRGVIVDGPKKITTRYNIYYRVVVEVGRKSVQKDFIPVIIKKELVDENVLFEGQQVEIEGEYNSKYVTGKDGRRHLDIFIFANQILPLEGEIKEDKNVILLEGFIMKEVQMRLTPFGRKISDIMLVVGGKYEKKHDIPCIAWGRLAEEISGKPSGTKIRVLGRAQSREYVKKYYDTKKSDEKKVTYEISIIQMDIK